MTATNMRLAVLGCIFGIVMLSLFLYEQDYHHGNVSPTTTQETTHDGPSFGLDTFLRCFQPRRLSSSKQKATIASVELYHLIGSQISAMRQLQTQYEGGGIPWTKVLDSHSSLLDNKIAFSSIDVPGRAARWSIDTPEWTDGYHHVLVGNFPCAEHGLCALPWLVRPNSTDMRSMWNHFVQNEYGLLLEVQHFDPEYILDAGGVGMAPVFFALLFPRATILRLEPHPSNFRIGVMNSLTLPNIQHVNLGLWDKETELQLCDNVDISWGEDWPFEGSKQQAYFSREPKDPPCKKLALDDIHVARLSSIMRTFNIPRFDMMKVDIEGAELRAFKEPDTQRIISETTLFIIELHDRMMAGSSKSVVEAFQKDGTFERFSYDENDVWVKKCSVGLCGSKFHPCM